MAKWVALTGRKLKPGTYDDWRKAWELGETPPGATAYLCRNVGDPNEIVAFGVIEATEDELRGFRDLDDGGREEAMAPFIESVGTDGIYEVIEEVTF